MFATRRHRCSDVNIVLVTRQYWPAVGGVERVTMNLSQAFTERGHRVTVVAQSVDETAFGRMTHIIRERLRFTSFMHDGVSVVQFRPSRRRRVLLLPFAAELIPFGGRVSRRWLRAFTSGYYTTVVRGVFGTRFRSHRNANSNAGCGSSARSRKFSW